MTKYYGKETGIIGEQIEKLEKSENLEDPDGDGILTAYDKCPDDPDNEC